MIKDYGPPDDDLLRKTFHTLWSCRREDSYRLINATDILAVVAVVPHPREDRQIGSYDGQVYIVEKLGLDVMEILERPAGDDDDEDRQDEEEEEEPQ